jgi:hypothetical protein
LPVVPLVPVVFDADEFVPVVFDADEFVLALVLPLLPVPLPNSHCPRMGWQCWAPRQVTQAAPPTPQLASLAVWQAPLASQQPVQFPGPQLLPHPAIATLRADRVRAARVSCQRISFSEFARAARRVPELEFNFGRVVHQPCFVPQSGPAWGGVAPGFQRPAT